MVTIEIKKNTALVFLAFAALLAGVFVVNAVWTAPAVWHDEVDVKVTTEMGGESSLKDAIDNGWIGDASEGIPCSDAITTGTSEKTSKVVAVPSYCQEKGCYIVLKYYQSGKIETLERPYSQDVDGYFNADPYDLSKSSEDKKNGDGSSDDILKHGGSARLYDDNGAQNSKDSWTLYDDTNSWGMKLYTCPLYNIPAL